MNTITKRYDQRYFIGLSMKVTPGINNQEIPGLWNRLMTEVIPKLDKDNVVEKYIGLEEYDENFQKTNTFTYSAMVELKKPIESEYYQQTLPSGVYISFEIEFDKIMSEIGSVYSYIRKNDIDVSFMFDFEDYLPDQDYSKKGQMLHLTLKMN